MTEAALAAAARSVFETGAEWIDPDYVLNADVPLELSGEAIRARLCIFSGKRGEELVMRPDLTLPVAMREAARREAGASGVKAYAYAARAFRLPAASDDPGEFTQAGFENFGAPSSPGEDAASFEKVMRAVEACGARPQQIVMGDLALFPAFVDALSLPPVMAGRLKRAFRQEGGVKALLETGETGLSASASRVLASADPEAALLEALSAKNLSLPGARSAVEIIDGLRARAEAERAGGVPDRVRHVLVALGAVSCPAANAAGALSRLCSDHQLTGAEDAIEKLSARAAALTDRRLAAICQFRSGFGRRFTYYDGFLFEIFGSGLSDRQPIAAGGRYDGLIAALSGQRAHASGIGGVVRPDRILRVKASAP